MESKPLDLESKPLDLEVFEIFDWFPRAGVGTDSGRASVLWVTRRWRVAKAFPRQRVGTRKMRSHASAWERENHFPFLVNAIRANCPFNFLIIFCMASIGER
ncbi:hypothetical protein QUF54_04610 [Candidatus Marithioploca araucensis]|uniref:Uncharacterized protein n=1 Tax=Candidatus Marithioploca araucensis TaxID=70273 RepID=A0ABT7VSS7_9GAMM|nr:hypothetical protein [Candidatus Marithioploca araucensis]